MTPQSDSARYVNVRLVGVAVIFFLLGQQLRNSFRSVTITNASTTDGFWAPADVGAPDMFRESKRDVGNEFDITDTTREGEQPVKLTVSRKKPSRFSTSNYSSDFKPLSWTLPKPTPLRDLTSEEFMTNYIAAKRKHKIALPWEEDEKYEDKNVSLPLPIIALNFPKSATLTVKAFFECGGLTAIHTSTQSGRIGICMMENQFNDKPPMDGCNTHQPRNDEYNAVYPIDFISDIGLQGPPCYYASLHDGGLENIARHYPDATIMLVIRNATSWARSMAKWGGILKRWRTSCRFDGRFQRDAYWRNMYKNTPESNRNEEYWVNFYHAHTQKVREFAMEHLSLTYFEVELENDSMGKILQQYTKISHECLLDCHPGPKWIKINNATSQCHPIGQGPVRTVNIKEKFEPDEEGSDDDENEDETGD